mmetsp:Transcript_49486/g.105800  ORF Transcript_49486/g.105800 Transcript_49486/m.105800 type:complete len:252 (+) Transcript_49486:3-758(+)
MAQVWLESSAVLRAMCVWAAFRTGAPSKMQMRIAGSGATTTLLVAFACLAGVSAAGPALPEDDSIAAGVQSALLLSALLPPQAVGPRPSQAQEDQVARAGPLAYSAYGLLQVAGQRVEDANQRLQAGGGGTAVASSTGGVAADLAAGTELLRRAKGKLKKGEALAREARSAFLAGADPLGPPPQAPREWDAVDAAAGRARAKLVALQQRLVEAKRLAGRSGVRLAEGAGSDLKDSYGAQQDSKILSFLARY